MMRTRTAPFSGLVALAACGLSTPLGSLDELPVGTWGGDNAGLIVTETTAHVHVGCTNGNFPAPIEVDEDGRFSVAGEYLLRAYPVAIGPNMPAQLAGIIEGRELIMTVAVNDTIEDKLVVLGPVSVRLDQDPELGPCPICVM